MSFGYKNYGTSYTSNYAYTQPNTSFSYSRNSVLSSYNPLNYSGLGRSSTYYGRG